MNLGTLAKRQPDAKVRLVFRNETGQTGQMVTTAAKAADPNASMRFFPPQGETMQSLGWPVPYWYAEEIAGIEVL